MARRSVFFGAVFIAASFVLAGGGYAQFVSFNDFAPGLFTHTNTTSTAVSGSVALKNVSDGVLVGVTVTVTSSGTTPGSYQGVPDYGTPADLVFSGYVDFSGRPDPGIELDTASDFLTYTFSGLDTNAEYNFQGTAMRGHSAYTNRWSLFEIVGAASFTNRHSPAALTTAQVPALTVRQVAINTGDNVQGVLAWWEHIRPAANGTFSITCKQYTGVVPGGLSGGSKGYGITGLRLEEAGTYSGRTNVPSRLPGADPGSVNGLQTVFMILMENHDWADIRGSTFCPYLNNTLLPMASYCNQYYSPHGVHPSEPNYLWLVAGTNFGIRDDSPPSANHQSSTNTLFHLLDGAGIPWRAYQEDISGTTCPDADSGAYAVRHNPFVFFDSVRSNFSYCTNHVRPYSELAGDLTNNTVARFNFITPNVINDMHDLASGSPSTRLQGDNWLAREVPKILASPAYTNGGALFITFDEGSGDSDGPVAMIVLSPRARGGGYNNNVYYTHSSTLRTLQDIFGVRPYLADAAYANNLGDLFKTIRLSSAQWLTNGFGFTFTNLIVGKTNYLQASSDLTADNWVTLQTNIATSAGIRFTDPEVRASRFYRVIELP